MDNAMLKYNLLGSSDKAAVGNFIDRLLTKSRKLGKTQSTYKANLLKVGQWSDQDIKSIESGTAFNSIKPEEW